MNKYRFLVWFGTFISGVASAQIAPSLQKILKPDDSKPADGIEEYVDNRPGATRGDRYYYYSSGRLIVRKAQGAYAGKYYDADLDGTPTAEFDPKGGVKKISDGGVERWSNTYYYEKVKLPNGKVVEVQRIKEHRSGDQVADRAGTFRRTNKYDKLAGPYPYRNASPSARNKKFDFVAASLGSSEYLHPHLSPKERYCSDEQKKINAEFGKYLYTQGYIDNWIARGMNFSNESFFDPEEGAKHGGDLAYAQVDTIRIDALPVREGPSNQPFKLTAKEDHLKKMTFPDYWRGRSGNGAAGVHFPQSRRGFIVNVYVDAKTKECVFTPLQELKDYADVINNSIMRGRGRTTGPVSDARKNEPHSQFPTGGILRTDGPGGNNEYRNANGDGHGNGFSPTGIDTGNDADQSYQPGGNNYVPQASDNGAASGAEGANKMRP